MRDYALVFLVTAAVTYLLTPLVRRIAVRTHAMHEPRARDTHVQATPLLGGLAMYGGLVAGLLIASRLSFVQDPFQSAGSRSQAGLLLAGGLVVVVGFADDRWGLSAISRLAAQVAAAGILVWSGQALPWLPTPNGGVFSLEPDLSVTLTILLVVVTMNAINFIDGLDGLAAGIVAVAALSFLAYSYSLIKTIGTTSQSLPAVTSALLAGMCIGFLPHNFYPARIFMGDIGAMLLGLLLAYGPISSTDSFDPALLIAYSHNHPLDRFPTVLPLLVPAAIFIIPYADLMFAVIRRTKAGKPLMAADRQHLHHRLLNIGHSYRQSVLLMYLWAALFSVTVVSLSLVRTPSVVFFAATLVAVLALLPVTMPRLRPWRTRPPARPRPAAGPRRPAARPSAPVPPAHAAPAQAPPAYAPSAQGPHAPAAPSATAPSATAPPATAPPVPPSPYAPVPPVSVPSAHAATAAVPHVPRFLPAAPSNGTNGATPPGANGFAGQAHFPGQDQAPFPEREPFPGTPVPPGRAGGHWEQVSPNHPAPWPDGYGHRDAAAPQAPFPGPDGYGHRDAAAPQGPRPGPGGFFGPRPYAAQSPFPDLPDPEDGTVAGYEPFSQVQHPDAWPR